VPTVHQRPPAQSRTSGPPNGSDGSRLPASSAVASSGKVSGRLALLVWLSLCAIWGSTWLGIKLGLRDLPPLTFAGIRFALAALVLGALVAIRGARLPLAGRDWRLLGYTGFLSITVNYALVFWGEQYISSGLAAVLSATVPLFGLPIAHRYLASERLSASKVAGVLLGVIGVAIVFSGELSIGGPQALWASAGIILAALATAHAGVLVKAQGTHIEPSVLAGVQMPEAASHCCLEDWRSRVVHSSSTGPRWRSLAWAT
jgi:drug/metabolite transporter (DMT)-like permease